MAPKNQGREAREARERLRVYQARQGLHQRRTRRRRRDNLFGLVVLVVIAALATGSQIVHANGVAADKASAKASASASAAASASATATATPTPTPTDADTGDVPSSTIAEGATWDGTLTLNKTVKLGVQLDGQAAPQAVSVLIDLIRKKFYTGTTCHRLSVSAGAEFLQCGSANGDGTGDAGFEFGPVENAPADGSYPSGTIAMARSTSQYSQTTQFFIVFGDTTLDTSTGGYTVVGKITSGLSNLKSTITSKGIGGTAASDGSGAPKVTTTITGATIAKAG